MNEAGFVFVRLDGSMPQAKRALALERFKSDPEVAVGNAWGSELFTLIPFHFFVQAFLISLRSGGVGLNLTAATHVMLMDPWWNYTGARMRVCSASPDSPALALLQWKSRPLTGCTASARSRMWW